MTDKQMKRKKRRSPLKAPIRLTLAMFVLIASCSVLLVLMNTTSPEDVGPRGVTTSFILLYVAILTTFTLVKMLLLRTTKVTLERLVGIALIPTILIAMRSIRQLTVVDVTLIVLFAVLVNFYLRRANRDFNSH